MFVFPPFMRRILFFYLIYVGLENECCLIGRFKIGDDIFVVSLVDVRRGLNWRFVLQGIR